MSIDSSRAKDAALQAAAYVFEGSSVLDAEAKALVTKAIAAAVEAAFDALEDMQADEARLHY